MFYRIEKYNITEKNLGKKKNQQAKVVYTKSRGV